MRAICTKCGALRYWKNRRGSEMPRVCDEMKPGEGGKITACGGALVLAAWTVEGWKAAKRAPQVKRKGAICFLCRKLGFIPWTMIKLEQGATYLAFCLTERRPGPDHCSPLVHHTVRLFPGDTVCHWHQSHAAAQKCDTGRPYPVQTTADVIQWLEDREKQFTHAAAKAAEIKEAV